MKPILLISVLLALCGMTASASAEVEAIHDRTFRTPDEFCQGNPRAYMPSRLGIPSQGFDLTGPGTLSLELFGFGVDWGVNDIRIAGSGVNITYRYAFDGFRNNDKLCTAIGSVILGLEVGAVPVDKTVYLEASGTRIPIRLHARALSRIRWGSAWPSGGSATAANCLRLQGDQLRGNTATPVAGKVSLDAADPSILRLTLSPDDIETLTQCGSAAPTDLMVGFQWDRENGRDRILFNERNEDAVKVIATRTQLAGPNLPFTTGTPTGTSRSTALKFKISDLIGFVGTATYEVRLSAASGPPSAPLRLIIDTVPGNGVRDMTFGVPAPTSEVRKLRVNYTLRAPAQAGQMLKWATYAFQANASGVKTSILNTCFAVPKGESPMAMGATTGTIELPLTDAPGCASHIASVHLRVDSPTPPEFNFTPLSGVERMVDLPAYASLKVVKPTTATTTPSLTPSAIKPALTPGG